MTGKTKIIIGILGVLVFVSVFAVVYFVARDKTGGGGTILSVNTNSKPKELSQDDAIIVQAIGSENPDVCADIKDEEKRKECVYNIPYPDRDQDGLDEQSEIDLGLDDRKADFDSDGLVDGEEAGLGTDPKSTDTDGDGLDDKNEIEIGTDPLISDTDGDGFSDGEEVNAGYNPLGSGKMRL